MIYACAIQVHVGKATDACLASLATKHSSANAIHHLHICDSKMADTTDSPFEHPWKYITLVSLMALMVMGRREITNLTSSPIALNIKIQIYCKEKKRNNH